MYATPRLLEYGLVGDEKRTSQEEPAFNARQNQQNQQEAGPASGFVSVPTVFKDYLVTQQRKAAILKKVSLISCRPGRLFDSLN